jgi:hypothetical protein
MADNRVEMFGALVGWTHQDLGERLMIRLQSTRQPGPAAADLPVDEFHYVLTKNQAVVLAQYLYSISGRLPRPARKRRWFS